MAVPLVIPAAAGLARHLAGGVLTQWGRAALGKEGIGMLAKNAPRLSRVGVALGAGGEALEDLAGVAIPEAVPSTILGAGMYSTAKDALLSDQVQKLFHDKNIAKPIGLADTVVTRK